MTENDIIEIESNLDIRVPDEYREFILSSSSLEIPGVIHDPKQIIAINLRNRAMSWLGRPLDRVFYIFATDPQGREVFINMDISTWLVMVADYEGKQGKVLALKFQDWVSKHASGARIKTGFIWLTALGALFLIIDFFPRTGPPDFRYTGSDPGLTVLNLGLPLAHFIYDERLSQPLIMGPLAPFLLLAEFIALAAAIFLMASVRICRRFKNFLASKKKGSA